MKGVCVFVHMLSALESGQAKLLGMLQTSYICPIMQHSQALSHYISKRGPVSFEGRGIAGMRVHLIGRQGIAYIRTNILISQGDG